MTSSKNILTQAKLKEILHYSPDIGIFTYKKRTANRIHVGDIAGSDSYGYLLIYINGKFYKAHRLAWLYVYGEWPIYQIDHINHIKDDNRIINLRDVTHKENHKNQSIPKNNTTGICGVYWHKRDKTWYAQIMENGVFRHIGSYKDFFEAACARKSAEYKLGFHENHGTERPL